LATAALQRPGKRQPGQGRVHTLVSRFGRDLERLGLVKYVFGRNGRETSIELSVGKPLADRLREAAHAVDPQPYDLPKPADDTHTHTFRLRDARDIELRLPKDLTRREAERIALFVQSLPVE